MKYYVETNFTDSQLPSSQDLNTLSKRAGNAASLIGKTLASAWGNDKVVNSDSKDLDKVLYYDQSSGTYTDYTDNANRNQKPYFPSVAVNTADYTYYGYRDQFTGLSHVMGSAASATVNPTVEYYVGSWVDVVSLSDGTSGLTVSGNMTWTLTSMTSSWISDDLNTILSVSNADSIDRYWVRISQTNNNAWGIKRGYRSSETSNELEVTAHTSPGMFVAISPGYAIVNERLVSVDAKSLVAIAAPASNNRYTIIQISDDAIVSIKNGTSAATPTVPETDDDNIKLAEVITSAGSTSILSANITDTREFTGSLVNAYDTPRYLTDGDTTPDVTEGRLWITANTATTTISDFSGVNGQVFRLLFDDSNTVIKDNGLGSSWSANSGDHMTCVNINHSWYCDINDNTV